MRRSISSKSPIDSHSRTRAINLATWSHFEMMRFRSFRVSCGCPGRTSQSSALRREVFPRRTPPVTVRRVVLFIATSADGFIARTDGAIDWLPSGDGSDYGYRAFLKTVDTLLIGRKTYDQVLAPIPFPYPDKRTYVFTRTKPSQRRVAAAHPSVTFVKEDPVAFVRRLRRSRGSAIWLVGGAQLIRPLQEAGLIDEYIISICPVFIGTGIPLFLATDREMRLRLTRRKVYGTGVVQLTYVPRASRRLSGTGARRGGRGRGSRPRARRRTRPGSPARP